jgi:hypothetical protein
MEQVYDRVTTHFPSAPLSGINGWTMSKHDDTASTPDATTPPSPSSPEKVPDLATAAGKSVGKGIWTGAAVGIGSAAIVAALLYTRRKG